MEELFRFGLRCLQRLVITAVDDAMAESRTNDSEDGPFTSHMGMTGESMSTGRSLQSILTDLTENSLAVSPTEERDILFISSKIASILHSELKDRCQLVNIPEFTFPKEPELIGSSSDGTRIRGKGDCDYLLHMQLPDSSSSYLSHQGEGYWKIKIDPTMWMKRLTLNDGWFSCLSPLAVHSFLVGKIQNIIDDGMVHIRGVNLVKQVSHQAGPAIKLKVRYLSYDTFDMDIVPCFTINGKQLVGKRHPSLGHDHQQTRQSREDLDRLRWRQSYSTVERDRIKYLDRSCKEVYQLVKYLRYNHPQFRQFNSFVFKTAFLYTLDDHYHMYQCGESCLAECLLDYMKKLEEFFNDDEMNHYYLLKKAGIKRNLLDPVNDSAQINEFYYFLRRKNSKGQSAWARVFESL